MSTFIEQPLQYTLPSDIKQEQLDKHWNFQAWLTNIRSTLELQADPSHSCHHHPFKLYGIRVLSANWWKGKLGFLMCEFDIHNKHGQADSEQLPGFLFVHGGSVAVLIILEPEEAEFSHEQYVILTVQPRIAAGSLQSVELPAGMMDEEDSTIVETAIREIKEECDLDFSADELVNMTELSWCPSGSNVSRESHLAKAIFPSPGSSYHHISIFLARKKMTKQAIDAIRGKATGLVEEDEKITLKIVKLQDVFKEATRDGKALAAMALYEGLKREGKI